MRLHLRLLCFLVLRSATQCTGNLAGSFAAVPGPWYGLRGLKVLGDRTSFDTYIVGTDGSGRLVGVGIEVKYTDMDIELADPNLFA